MFTTNHFRVGILFFLTGAIAIASACRREPTVTRSEHDGAPCPCQERSNAHNGHHGSVNVTHAGHGSPLPATGPLPGQSVYQLSSNWHNQDNVVTSLTSFRGHPTLVLMFYGTCRSVCPLLIGDLLRIEQALTPEIRTQMRFVLVTFDPQRDTPEQLRELAHERSLDTSRWTLLHSSDDNVRDLAMVLGVQYRSTGDGQFSHSNLITLLDREGVVNFQLEGVRQPVEPMVNHIQQLVSP